MAAYCCSKAAMTMLTRTSATELGKFNIRVNAIRPGGMKTEIYKDVMNDPITAQEGMKILERAAIKKQLETSDVANLTYFLSSSQSSMITGEDVAIDGGIGVA